MAGSGFQKAAEEGVARKRGRPPGPAGTTRRNVLAAQRLFQEYAQEALDTMVSIMRDPDADDAVRLKASNDVLSRAYGTPVSVSVQHQIQERESGSPISAGAISSAGTAELMKLAAALSKYVEDQGNIIDVTPEMPESYPDK